VAASKTQQVDIALDITRVETYGAGGIVPLKKLGGGDGDAFIPPNI